MKLLHFEVKGELLSSTGFFEGELFESEGLELAVDLDDGWQGAGRVFALFSGGELPAPRPVELVDGACVVPEAVLKGEQFVVALIGQDGGHVAMTTNGVSIDMLGGSATELEFTPISVDLLVWLWDWYESDDGGGAGTTGVEIVQASNEAAALSLSQANPSNIYFWV